MSAAVIDNVLELRSLMRKAEQIVGFVPTMGYLHEGHLSLVDAARKDCDLVVASIFVNPTQFGPNEDYSSYPRDITGDLELLRKRGVDYVFVPSTGEMYPAGYSTWVEVKGITEVLCGSSRPTHFKGVCTVVLKLMNIVNPNYMYMGAKDYQQVCVLRRMVEDLNLETQIIACPIIREKDGLAMSSRNKYLSASERIQALCLYKAIQKARELYADGKREINQVLPVLRQIINTAGGEIDYLEFRNEKDLVPEQELNDKSRLFLAVKIGKTRLIDNSALV